MAPERVERAHDGRAVHPPPHPPADQDRARAGRPSAAAIAATSSGATSASSPPAGARPSTGERAERVEVVAVRRAPGIGAAALEEARGDGHREGEVAAGARLHEAVGERRRLVADRVDQDELRAAPLRLAEHGEEVELET